MEMKGISGQQITFEKLYSNESFKNQSSPHSEQPKDQAAESFHYHILSVQSRKIVKLSKDLNTHQTNKKTKQTNMDFLQYALELGIYLQLYCSTSVF